MRGVCVHPDSKLRVWQDMCFVHSLKQQQGDAGEFCSRHPTKTLQFSCDMERTCISLNGIRLSREPVRYVKLCRLRVSLVSLWNQGNHT